ncbi:MAG: molybdopterin molybdotransferase MoeA [Gammaproteobacteria bacterium]|nr:molybdopterin molybdotransferase MoeA [Gammaproteobacteria bacterium]
MTEENPLLDAQKKFIDTVPFRAMASEKKTLSQAFGMALYTDLIAPENSPSYHRAIVEGFLVNTADAREASEETPVSFVVVGEVNPGDEFCPDFLNGQAVSVATGSIIPEGDYSIVRMWEAKRDGKNITITRPFPPRFFIEEEGCDIKQGSVVVEAGTVLSPAYLGAAASLGLDSLETALPPKVTIFSSGDEVVPHTEAMRPGMIRDCNSVMLSAAVMKAGGSPNFAGIMSDDFDGFVNKARSALETSDMLLISGGTAVNGRDFISDLVRELGDLLVDGVQMRSGRPLIMGIANGKPIVCVAGYPPEALRGFELFGVAAIKRLLGKNFELENI